MTREEAINAFKEWIERDKQIEYADRLENIEIYRLAIKALESKDVLDKISAEMREIDINLAYQENYDLGASWGLRKALEIIDKYKAESEEVD